MRLSIIIPVYNAQGFLGACVEPVLEQMDGRMELILVNDGSKDGSGALCDAYAARDPRVRVIHQENRGPGGARNTGLEAARGEYVWFVDSDDGILPGAMEKIMTALERRGPDILSFDYLADDGSGTLTPKNANRGAGEGLFTLAQCPEFLNAMPATWARVWRRSLYLDNGIRYPERAYYGEDLQTSGKLFALAEGILVLRAPAYRYLDRPGSLMNTADPGRNRHMLTAVGELADWYASRGLGERFEAQLCEIAIEHLLMAATVRVSKANPADPLLLEIQKFMEERFPRWRENPAIGRMGAMRRFALYLIEGRSFRLLGWLFRRKG